MPNVIWYIILAVLSLGVCTFTIYIKKEKYPVSMLIVFYLFAAGITWIGEFTVLGLFNSYAYKTGLYISPWAQNLLGHLLLNTTLYPAAAFIIVVYSLRNYWILIITAIFISLEYVFIKMRLYEQHWWRYYLTVITTIVFLSICKYWFPKMIKKPFGVYRNITFYFVAMVIIHIPAPILLLLGKQYYRVNWIDKMFGDLYISSTVFIFIYDLIEAFFLVLFVCILKNRFWKVVPFIISGLVQIIFLKYNILVLENGWKFINTILIFYISIMLFILLEEYELKTRSIYLKTQSS